MLVTRHSNKANLFEQQQQEANYSIRMQRSNGSSGDDDCKQLQFKVEVIGAATAPDLSAAQPALFLLSLCLFELLALATLLVPFSLCRSTPSAALRALLCCPPFARSLLPLSVCPLSHFGYCRSNYLVRLILIVYAHTYSKTDTSSSRADKQWCCCGESMQCLRGGMGGR